MPPRKFKSSKPKAPKPIFFGPDRPPPVSVPTPTAPADPSRLPAGQAGEPTSLQAAQDLGEGGGGKRKRKSRPRKKFKTGNGWEENRIEPEPHEEDVERYDPALPFDLRMLRAIDEWRSLRALPFDLKLSFDSVLNHFEMDVQSLRQKYGRQSLRGYNPDEGESEEGEGGSDDDEGDEEEKHELEDTEEEWASERFSVEVIAKWLDDRANDGYTPTLTTAPQVMANFLRFLIARNVLPQHTAKVKAAIPMCDQAKLQLPATSVISKTLPPPFHRALHTLFPSLSSTLASPIAEHDAAPPAPTDTIPDLVPATAFVEDTTDLNLDTDTVPLDQSLEGWPAVAEGEGDGDAAPKALEEQRRKLEGIRKALEADAKSVEAWKEPKIKEEDATAEVRAVMKRLGYDVEAEGEWNLVTQERSARMIMAWESIPSASKGKEKEGVEERTIVRMELGAHLAEFPITAFSHSHTQSTTSSLDTTITLHLDLSPSVLKHLLHARSLVLEADLSCITFSSSSPSHTTSTSNSKPVWFLTSLYRILPSYWPQIGESLRDEPGRQRDWEGEWEAPEGMEKHWIEPEGRKEESSQDQGKAAGANETGGEGKVGTETA